MSKNPPLSYLLYAWMALPIVAAIYGMFSSDLLGIFYVAFFLTFFAVPIIYSLVLAALIGHGHKNNWLQPEWFKGLSIGYLTFLVPGLFYGMLIGFPTDVSIDYFGSNGISTNSPVYQAAAHLHYLYTSIIVAFLAVLLGGPILKLSQKMKLSPGFVGFAISFFISIGITSIALSFFRP